MMREDWIATEALDRFRPYTAYFPPVVGPAVRPFLLAAGTEDAGYAGFADGTAEAFDDGGPEPWPVTDPVVVTREAFWAAESGDWGPLHSMNPVRAMPLATMPTTSAISVGRPREPPRASTSFVTRAIGCPCS